jgi:hypothetical protein
LALIAAFGLAAALRSNRWRHRLLAIILPAALVPITIAFDSFVYPASPESQIWWPIAVVTGTLYGLVAAASGYALAAFAQRQRGA